MLILESIRKKRIKIKWNKTLALESISYTKYQHIENVRLIEGFINDDPVGIWWTIPDRHQSSCGERILLYKN